MNPFKAALSAILTSLDKLAQSNKVSFMLDDELLVHINADAEEGRFNTPHSREYDCRRGFRNGQKKALQETDVQVPTVRKATIERPGGERCEAP